MTSRIPQSDIDRARFDILSVIESRIDLKKTGKNYSACCPFHKEKSASFTVEPGKGFYYCFGCGAGGSAIDFVMEYEGLDFPAAVAAINGDLPSTVTAERVTASLKTDRSVSHPATAKTRPNPNQSSTAARLLITTCICYPTTPHHSKAP